MTDYVRRQVLPSKSDIKRAMVEFLVKQRSATTKEINQYIINKFNIDEELYSEKNDYENTTIFAYRMCWIRTELRQQGIISNPVKGVWEIHCKK